MLEVHAKAYITLGRQIADAELLYSAQAAGLNVDLPSTNINFHLSAMLEICEQLGLATSRVLLKRRQSDPPQTGREFALLVDAIWAELEGKLFLFVPPHRAKYYKLILPSIITTKFPAASRELVLAGNGIAAEMYTASVFHSMRAVEIGLQAMARALGVAFSYPIELAEWGKIIGEIEPKIAEIQIQPRSTERDENLKFYSEAASQFRHFNNGWRVRTAHPRETYEESQAIEVFDHALSFFQTLSSRLKELSS